MARKLTCFRKPAALGGLVLLAVVCLFAVRHATRGSDPWTGPIPAQPPSETEDPAKHLPVSFTIKERAGIDRPEGLAEAGVPFAPGEVDERFELKVSENGRSVPASFTPLAWWPDGSVRWAKLTLPVKLAADEAKQFTLTKGKGPTLVAPSPPMPDMTVRLVTREGTATFPVTSSESITRGDCGVVVDIDVLTARRVRIRVEVRQLTGDAFWKALTFEVAAGEPVTVERKLGAIRGGNWSAAIRQAAERGPKDVEARDGRLLLHLYPPSAPPYPADQGFHVTHEIVLEQGAAPDDLARRVAKPLRVSWPPGYVHATRAMGRTGMADERSRALDRSFAECWKHIRAQQALPRNRGWTAWGGFFDRAHGAAYSGFLNQEYDPATAFFIYHARTGDPTALDTALDMARQYADNSVSLRGGCYQHRSTFYAIQGHIAKSLAGKIRERWRKQPDVPLRDAEVLAHVRENYGDKAARAIAEFQQDILQRDPAERERVITEQIAYALVRDGEQRMKEDETLHAQLRKKYGARFESTPLFRDVAEYLQNSPNVKPFGLPAVDEVFTSFFSRYGGSWQNFPVFHFYDLPIAKYNHRGGHSLAEMLVWGYLWTGDPSLRRAALRVARHHVENGLVEQGIQHVKGELAAGNVTFAREVGWPLVNLLALEVLTERAEPQLDVQVKQAIRDLVSCILSIPPDRYQGAIHIGVVSEGLARYHEQTGEPEVREYLVRLMRYWAAAQWNSRRQGFHYIKDQPDPTWRELSAFSAYGLTYAAWQSGDERLAERARQVLEGACASHPNYVKSFAQQFHNSQRAAALLPLLHPPAPK